jgi:hypothetical protein
MRARRRRQFSTATRASISDVNGVSFKELAAQATPIYECPQYSVCEWNYVNVRSAQKNQ